VTATSGSLSRKVPILLKVVAVKTGAVAVDLTSTYNITGIYTDGSTFARFLALMVADSRSPSSPWAPRKNEMVFCFGSAQPLLRTSSPGETITLRVGKFGALKMLAAGVQGSQKSQTFTVAHADGTSSTFTQRLSDWYSPGSFSGESTALTVPYRLAGDGETDDGTFHIFGYLFDLVSSNSVALPGNRNVVVLSYDACPGVKQHGRKMAWPPGG
jgi:hypothetical protein